MTRPGSGIAKGGGPLPAGDPANSPVRVVALWIPAFAGMTKWGRVGRRGAEMAAVEAAWGELGERLEA